MGCNQEANEKLERWLHEVIFPNSFCQPRTGDPVNVTTGAFEHSEEDVSIPTQRLSLTFTRYYNNQYHAISSGLTSQSFGPGWTHSFGLRLESQAKEDGAVAVQDTLTFVSETGSRLRFVRNDSGEFIAPPGGLGMTLTPRKEGGYSLRQVDGFTANFQADGRLEMLLQPGPQKDTLILFHYDEKKRLIQAEGASGRSLRFWYAEDNLIRAMSDHTGRRWGYRYNAQGELEQVFDPGGRVRKYVYIEWKRRVSTERKKTGLKTIRALRQVLLPRFLEDSGAGIPEVTNAYTTEQKVHLQEDACGGRIRFEYNHYSKITSVTDAEGNTTLYCAESRTGNTTKIRKPGGGISEYLFDERGNLLAEIDPLGHRTEYVTFNETVNLEEYRDYATRSLGTRAEFLKLTSADLKEGYDINGNRPLVRDALGNTTRFERYNGFGKPERTVLPDGSVIENDYDTRSGLPVRQSRLLQSGRKQPLRHIEAWEYDDWGNLTRQLEWAETAKGQRETPFRVQEFVWDAEGNHPLQSRSWTGDDPTEDAFAAVERYNWDALGRLTSKVGLNRRQAGSAPEEIHSFYGYDATSRPLWEIGPDGTATCVEYDGAGRIIERYRLPSATPEILATVTSEQKRERWRYEYDALGRLRFAWDPTGRKSEQKWDLRGLLSETVDPAGLQTTLKYDRDQNRIKEISPTGREINWVYNACGWLTEASDNLGRTIRTTHDALGRVVQVMKGKDAEASTRYEYDDEGRVREIRFPDNRSERINYDEFGQIISLERGWIGGVATSQETRLYDGLGRLSEIHFGAPGSLVLQFRYEYDDSRRTVRTYDALGNVKEQCFDTRNLPVMATDAEGQSVEYTVDAAGRLVRRRAGDGSLEATFDYDAFGRPINAISGATAQGWDYDEAGRLMRHRQTVEGETRELSLRYDDAGREVERCMDDHWWQRVHYSTVGLPEQLELPGAQIQMKCDAAGRVLEETWNTGQRRQADYTPEGDLQTLSYQDGQQQLIFEQDITRDAVGRPLKEQKKWRNRQAFYEYGYDERDQLVRVEREVEGKRKLFREYVYDARGNRVQETRNGKEYCSSRYDLANRLLERQVDSGTIEPCEYDANGNLLRRGNHIFQYDAFQRLVQAANDETNDKIEYRYTATGEVASTYAQGNLTRWFSVGGQPVVMQGEANEEKFFWGFSENRLFAQDKLSTGFQAVYTDQAASVLDDEGQTEYDPFGGFVNGMPLEPQFGFQGKWFDPTAEVYQNRARFLDPEMGRFTQTDPMGTIDDPNAYLFASNNPVTYRDDSGFRTERSSQGRINRSGGVSSALDYLVATRTKLVNDEGGHINLIPQSYMDMKLAIDMRFAPTGSATNAAGFPRDNRWFWKQMLQNHSEVFDQSNTSRIRSNIAPVVNDLWIQHNPTHMSFEGDRLVHHHILQEHLAVGIPETVHRAWHSTLHPKR